MKFHRFNGPAIDTADDAREAVAEGIAALDAAEPDWRTCVDVERLDLASHSLCVLGQVYQHYGDAPEHLQSMGAFWTSVRSNNSEANRLLEQEWIRVLESEPQDLASAE